MPAPAGSPTPDQHCVVFDLNVLLDVADLLGPPFTWDKFTDAVAHHHTAPLPNAPDRRVDSLRAIAVATTGLFAGPEPLNVYTSEHLESLLVRKASQPRDGVDPERRGLGWGLPDAEDLLDDLLRDLVYDKTGGAFVEVVAVTGRPQLDHEDAKVFSTALQAEYGQAPPPLRYCVTRDRKFRTAAGLDPKVHMMYPDEFVRMVRAARSAIAFKAMRPTI